MLDFLDRTHRISCDWTHLAWATGGAVGTDDYSAFFLAASFRALTPR